VRRARDLLAPLLACALAPASAYAAPTAHLHVAFNPDQLGASTNVAFDIRIDASPGRTPPPLTQLALHYPRDLGLAVSGLGLDTCSQQTLEALGPQRCPANSHMGQGSALAEIQFGQEVVPETAELSIVRAPEQGGHIGLLFYAYARAPVSTEVAFPGQLLPAPPPHDESINITVPLVPALPEGPDVALVALHASFGPRGLTYYERVHGRLVAYHPQGILLPRICPHRGFAFNATVGFLDGSHSTASTRVPCPAGHHAGT